MFENIDYYDVTIGYNKSENGSYTVINEMIYKVEKYIGELIISSNIKSVINMKK